MDIPRCARHPDVETRLTCSSCGTPICPDCLVDAAVSYHCPDCAEARGQRIPTPKGRGPSLPFGTGGSGGSGKRGPARTPPSEQDGSGLPPAVGVRTAAAAVGGAMTGGLILGPVLLGGTFFLLSAGVVGWGIARLVFWASQERSTPFVRAVALTATAFAVAVGLAVAGHTTAPPGVLFLAYPAAVYGGWLVVRQR